MYHITKSMEFDSAHSLRDYPGKCANVHGHTYKMIVCVAGEGLNSVGMLYDFFDLKKVMSEVVQNLDHHYINEIPPFDELNPTAENIAYYVYQVIKTQIVQFSIKAELRLHYVEIWETPTCSARYSED